MPQPSPIRIRTITDYHRQAGLPAPEHPLITVIDIGAIVPPAIGEPMSLTFDFYAIFMKRVQNVKFRYGQQACDFDEGALFFMSPGQVLSFEIEAGASHQPNGWMIFVHPDFLWNTSLAKTIKQYDFFDYSVSEALFLSEKEEAMLTGIVRQLEQEYHTSIDRFSQKVIIAQLELFLTYAERYYQRQFITRKTVNHALLTRLESLLSTYFQSGALARQGLPSVAYIAQSLHVSPGYLSSMLKVLSGRTTQQYLHDQLIALAKEKLSTTNLSVSEIAYELGFEHLQSFSKLFKAQTNVSPLAFRRSFN